MLQTEPKIALAIMATLSRFLGLAPGHAGYSKIDVDVRIDAHADEGIRLAGDSRS